MGGKEVEVKYLIMEGGKEHIEKGFFILYPPTDATREEVYRNDSDMILTKALLADVFANGKKIKQGYMPVENGMEIAALIDLEVDFKPSEARLRDKGGKTFLTLKGEGGLTRNEVETEIHKDLFADLWHLTEGRRVEKVRLEKPYGAYKAEIDVYTDRDLIVAEIEVPSEEEAGKLTPIGLDVTEDKRFKNKNLAK
jgi:CYTH domain-containing protein